jgi:hypothetical protein
MIAAALLSGVSANEARAVAGQPSGFTAETTVSRRTLIRRRIVEI